MNLLRIACRNRRLNQVVFLARAMKIAKLPRKWALMLGMTGCIAVAKLISSEDVCYLFRKFTNTRIADEKIGDYALEHAKLRLYMHFLVSCGYEFTDDARNDIISSNNPTFVRLLKKFGYKFDIDDFAEAADNGTLEMLHALADCEPAIAKFSPPWVLRPNPEMRDEDERFAMIRYLCDIDAKFTLDQLFEEGYINGLVHAIEYKLGMKAYNFDWVWKKRVYPGDHAIVIVKFKVIDPQTKRIRKFAVPETSVHDQCIIRMIRNSFARIAARRDQGHAPGPQMVN